MNIYTFIDLLFVTVVIFFNVVFIVCNCNGAAACLGEDTLVKEILNLSELLG